LGWEWVPGSDHLIKKRERESQRGSLLVLLDPDQIDEMARSDHGVTNSIRKR
jgi:hypothetical protein